MSREIIIHSLEHALAALAAASACDAPVTLASAPGAALQTGPAWFKAVIDVARARYPAVDVIPILDCADSPGAVMAALREGLTMLRFSGSDTVREKLTGMGAVFAPAADAALDLQEQRQPEQTATRFLQQR